MEWLGSTWFMWVVMFIIACSIIAIVVGALEESGVDLDEAWYVIKKVLGTIIGMILLPFIIWFKKD